LPFRYPCKDINSKTLVATNRMGRRNTRRWNTVSSCFTDLETLNIPRHVGTQLGRTYQIHGFADGCCLYVRSVTSEGIKVRLLTAKSRVAPINRLSIPRLELCAAHLLAKLWSDLQMLNLYRVEQVTMWSESEVILFWLRTHLSKLKTFVANIVSAIHELAPTAVWRHVPTNFNSADLPSRGTTVKDFDTTLWFEGPSFLSMDSTH